MSEKSTCEINIKELLLEGMTIKMPYKERRDEWVGDISIHIFSGGFGMQPKIIIEGSLGRQEYSLDLLNSTIEYFIKSLLSEKNLVYKGNEAMRIITKDNLNIDLDNPDDYKLYEDMRLKLIAKV